MDVVPPTGEEDGFPSFPHLDRRGNARMVDVTGKVPSARRARARGRVTMSRATAARLMAGELGGRDLVAAARAAGIAAAKRTADLLPLCHPILLGDVSVVLEIDATGVAVEAVVEAHDRTGVEMEALTACAVAALTVFAACKADDETLAVDEVTVWEKAGGRSGSWTLGADGRVHHDPASAGPGVGGEER